MLMESDSMFFARRASDERAAAIRAKHPSARRAHLELAERHQDIADAIEAHYTLPRKRNAAETPAFVH